MRPECHPPLPPPGPQFRDSIEWALSRFAAHLEGVGPLGMLEFGLVYAALEMVAVPAIPLTISAGALFGVAKGIAIVSAAAVTSASCAFLVSRYLARRRIAEVAAKYPRFAAIDAAVGKDGFRVVLLLRLSPLLPFALSNYLYGLTSIKMGPYVLATWLGMLPGTFMYISAGALGRAALDGQETTNGARRSPPGMRTLPAWSRMRYPRELCVETTLALAPLTLAKLFALFFSKRDVLGLRRPGRWARHLCIQRRVHHSAGAGEARCVRQGYFPGELVGRQWSWLASSCLAFSVSVLPTCRLPSLKQRRKNKRTILLRGQHSAHALGRRLGR